MLLLGVDVHGSTLGIVGFGRIGQAVARRAAGFGMRVLYHARHRVPEEVERATGATWLPLPELLAASDFVSLHVSLSRRDAPPHRRRGARGRCGGRRSSSTPPVGPVVDTDALVDGPADGTIRAAALDVTDPEPLPADHPLVGLDNCIVVPHIASATEATRGRMAAMSAANLLAGVRGERLPHAREPRGLRPQRLARRPAAGPSSTRTRDGCDLTRGGT